MSSLISHAVAQIRTVQRQAASLLLYQSVLKTPVGQAFLDLLDAIHNSDTTGFKCLEIYGHWFSILASQNITWEDYLITQILKDDNPFSRQAQRVEFANLPVALVEAARHDLQMLQSIYNCRGEQITKLVRTVAQLSQAPIIWHLEQPEIGFSSEFSLRHQLKSLDNWGNAVEALAAYYRQCGTGIFAQYKAFQWRGGELVGIAHPDPVQLTQLVGYESPRDTLIKNTEFLLAGYPALHVLLYGSRGSGKSSLVKALLNKYRDRNLRLIEVGKSDLKDLPLIVEQLRAVPQKFIIFVDDLSFEEDDDAFKSLKVVLEGNVTARPQNVVVYATSNRRHLIREFFEDRPAPKDSDEVQAWDTMEEKLSFSDRFGLTLTFEPADQNTYLKIIRHLAHQEGINISLDDLDYRALQWATRHNGRSGRTARQFIDYLRAELGIVGQ